MKIYIYTFDFCRLFYIVCRNRRKTSTARRSDAELTQRARGSAKYTRVARGKFVIYCRKVRRDERFFWSSLKTQNMAFAHVCTYCSTSSKKTLHSTSTSSTWIAMRACTRIFAFTFYPFTFRLLFSVINTHCDTEGPVNGIPTARRTIVVVVAEYSHDFNFFFSPSTRPWIDKLLTARNWCAHNVSVYNME